MFVFKKIHYLKEKVTFSKRHSPILKAVGFAFIDTKITQKYEVLKDIPNKPGQ